MNAVFYMFCIGILSLSLSSLQAKEEFQEASLDLKAANAATEAAALKGGELLPDRPPFSLKKTLERVQTYLNSFSTFSAHFRQEDPDGTLRFGQLYVSRPGKMRFDYTAPTRLILVSDGAWISYDDPELEQVSYVPLSSTPASFILSEKIDFSSALVDKIEFSPEDEILITLRNKSEPDLGVLILTFKDHPLRLTGWQVVDQTTQTTLVVLKDLDVGITPPSGSFELSNPSRS
ncbi:MAG: hypothetical protein B7Y25_05575 [Alphaproteobacteria bacterium 16-39-46]|nr:MAG: hypothetical protein B7Y25_05575 [Alphaproteobacteria bacterium 16-39-46]OZA42619.1 MAG: hypothetical protein B7X84_05475 [Alphaproteobacteria bacterium 17-39-52]HQS84394.1 outer membrane lipoprotein carrier protein LolA [Alphaproteobacteria bacterium]HQS93952.1 outer membrane lipoprotein carrier protein LolA [Alphaproteobacteria bacterium]